ncbi:response regulator [Fontisphaera persica]|uniref:response regulator n=1 Tax=Fontisphaera persica TaxID=2974023 RepID=UPI0024C0B533|nr:response regulator [Fontisphaera persica]WCJ59020.1 response regulator [Fontisphaera persica]
MKVPALLILLVEDNADHAELVRRNLARHNPAHRLVHLRDGESALDYLFHRGMFAPPKAPPRPHLILLDLRLPKLDGLEVLRQVKQDPELHLIPTVVLTTSDAERDLFKAYDSHANSYLAKPLDYGAFTGLLETFGRYWIGCNRYPWPETRLH